MIAPRTALLYITERCNLRCTYCFNEKWGRYGAPDMTPELALRFLAMADTWNSIWLGGVGEPTMSPDLPGIVRALEGREETIYLTTNGTRISALRHAVEWGNLDQINISCTDSDPVRYAEVTGRQHFRTLCKGIEIAVREVPCVRLTFVVSKQDIEHLAEHVDFAREMGASAVSFSSRFDNGDEARYWRSEVMAAEDSEVAERIAHQKAISRPGGVEVEWPARPVLSEPVDCCHMAQSFVGVSGSGDVCLCCHGTGPRSEMGNIADGPVWESGAMQELRERISGPPEQRPHKCFTCWTGYKLVR